MHLSLLFPPLITPKTAKTRCYNLLKFRRHAKPRGIPPQPLAECIRGKQPDDFVLTHKDGKDGSRVSQPRKNWYSLCAVSGLGKLSVDGRYTGLQMHDLRRSAVRRLVRRGISEKVCMAISGDKTRSMFDRYNITNERDLETAAKLLDGQTSPFQSETDTKTCTSGFSVREVLS